MRALAIGFFFVSMIVFSTGSASIAAQEATPAAECPTTTEDENIALVSRWYEEVWNASDLTVIDEILSDDYTRYRAGIPFANAAGIDDDIAWVEDLRAAFPDLTFSIEDIFADGDKVAVRTIATGTQMGPMDDMGGAPATERAMARENLAIWRVACGELVEQWIVQDNLGMLRQLGVITAEEMADADEPDMATSAP